LFDHKQSAQIPQMPGGQLFNYQASITKKTGRSLYAWGNETETLFFFLSVPFRRRKWSIRQSSPPEWS
jgi:hypothetical protein